MALILPAPIIFGLTVRGLGFVPALFIATLIAAQASVKMRPLPSLILAVVVTILSTIWDFKVFTQIYLMPGGSGGNDQVLNLGVWSYQQSFAQNEYGKGSAIAVMLTVILLLITGVYLRTLFKEKEL